MCHKFGAMGYSCFASQVMGITGATCARHMFVLPLGTVKMDQGEV